MTRRRTKVFVAMSGGVDSSVAAALLQKSGDFDVRGVFMKTWTPAGHACTWKEERRDAMRVTAKLGIPFQTWDFTGAYERKVVAYLKDEYMAGRTPNPDVMCNKEIKFGLFLQEALRQGADYVATGHYVRREPELSIINDQFSNNTGRVKNFAIKNSLKIVNRKLKIAKDANKDQSYFLWTLTQEQLRYCLFPIGSYTKPEVRKMARGLGLHVASKKDSQGLCFVGNVDFPVFLRTQLPRRAGALVTADGETVGEHDGAHFYTIGQRRGLGVGGGIPYYVTDVDTRRNTVIVSAGEGDALYTDRVAFQNANWIAGSAPEFPLHCLARIRYRQPLQECVITDARTVHFEEPQRAATPGQSVVFYDGEIVLGGGVIGSESEKQSA